MIEQRPATVAALLAASTLPALEARALLARQLGVAREQLIAHPEQTVIAADAAAFERLAERRRGGEPLAYVLGEKEFLGRLFSVTPDVLVPRPETELLVELALSRLDAYAPVRILDLGTGSGCIAISLALQRPCSEVVATDSSAAALRVARANAARLQARNVRFEHGDWFAALPQAARLDLIVANPPYVAASDPHLDDLRHEPSLALISGAAGLTALRTIVEGAPLHLRPGGWLMLEHGFEQGEAVRAMLGTPKWSSVGTHADAAGLERVTAARAV